MHTFWSIVVGSFFVALFICMFIVFVGIFIALMKDRKEKRDNGVSVESPISDEKPLSELIKFIEE